MKWLGRKTVQQYPGTDRGASLRRIRQRDPQGAWSK